MSALRQKRAGHAVLSLLGASSLALGAVGLAQGASLHKGLWQAGAGESSGNWTVVSNAKMSKVTALSNFFSQFVMNVVWSMLLLAGVLVLVWREDWRLGVGLTVYSVIATGVSVTASDDG